MRFHAAALALGAALSAGLAGCVTPPVSEPKLKLITTSTLGLGTTPRAAVADGWWRAYGDEQLNGLIDTALRDSPTLAQAMARLASAQAQVQAAGAPLRPGFTLDGEEVRQRYSENYIIPPPLGGGVYWQGQVGLNMNWSLDFWGRQAALLEQARAVGNASALDAASAKLALSGAIAQAYVELHKSWALGDIAQRSEQQRIELLKLAGQRVDAGLDTQIELKNAQALVPQARAARLQAEATRDLAVHRLAELSGQGAAAYAQIGRPHLDLDIALPLPDALPLDLLARRPDVLAAQARVAAATAGHEAARTAFYPNINLRAFAGVASIGLDHLFESSSSTYGAGPAIHLPLFDSQRLKAGYRGATAALDSAIADYNAIVLEAVRQVADQLSNTRSVGEQLAQQQQALAAAEQAYSIAQQRYAAGLTSQLVVLNAESQVLALRRELVMLQASQSSARVRLLLQLGGSFDPDTFNADALATRGSGVNS